MFNNSKYLVLNVSLFIVALLATNFLTKGSPEFMIFAGYFMAQYLMAGKLIFMEFHGALTGKGVSLKKIESSAKVRVFIVASSILLMFFSFVGWVVGWEGKTGIFYGCGILIGSILFELGLGESIKEYLKKYKQLA